jgi:hypothetical protein
MRIWLLALASCWTGPVTPAPVPPVAAMPAATRPALTPGGYFVPDLIAHRLETRALDDVDTLGGQLAVLVPRFTAPQTQLVGPRAITVANRFGNDERVVVEYCIDTIGRVTSASPPRALEQLRGWRFAPYFVAGKPVIACSYVDYSAIAP